VLLVAVEGIAPWGTGAAAGSDAAGPGDNGPAPQAEIAQPTRTKKAFIARGDMLQRSLQSP
jgi:hypothetical protein